MSPEIRRVYAFLRRDVWESDEDSLRPPWPHIVRLARYLRAVYVLIDEGQLSMRAMSLVYTTLLSLVPLLAVSFSVLKALGVHYQVQPVLQKFLAPLGPKGDEITARVIEFVGNMKVGVLGSVGLAMLIYTVVSLIYKIESSFNYIWRVDNPRSFARRFTGYMSLLLVGPIMIFSAMGITAAFMSTSFVERIQGIGPIGYLFYLAHSLLPYIITCAAFTFVYLIMPSTRVRTQAALAGGVFAGVIWELTGLGFARFVVSSVQYPAIYSGFAILIMFMIWVYISWLILLLGAAVSFYYQSPQYLLAGREGDTLSNRVRERLAFCVMYLVGKCYHEGDRTMTADMLAERLAVPAGPLMETLGQLEKDGLVVTTADDPPVYMPARDLETIQLTDVLLAVRAAGEGRLSSVHTGVRLPAVDNLSDEMERAMTGSLSGMTLHELVLQDVGSPGQVGGKTRG